MVKIILIVLTTILTTIILLAIGDIYPFFLMEFLF